MKVRNKNLHLQANITNYLNIENRPLELKNAINSLFSTFTETETSKWTLFNGDEYYQMSDIDEYKLLSKMVKANPDQSSFNIIDIGAGDYSWIQSMAKLFNNGDEVFANKNFNIFGLNGEGSPEVIEIENVKLHYYGGFKSEELLSEFNSKGHNLENNVDFIVSRFALRHMADPIGTVIQAYELLKPNTGLMIIDDFPITYKNLDGSSLYESHDKFEGHLKQFHFYSYLDANVLMCPSNTGARSFTHFNIQKLSADTAKLPITYSGLNFVSGRSHTSEYETEFTSLEQTEKMEMKLVSSSCANTEYYSGCYGDKELYDWFENNALFSNDPHYKYCGVIKSSGDISDDNHYDL